MEEMRILAEILEDEGMPSFARRLEAEDSIEDFLSTLRREKFRIQEAIGIIEDFLYFD